ncbi:MAG TPA: TetR/AcrR family transcriptional regulator [Methanobacteriaceae archaeon]|nr:TetR/AcrR family transcriptional regulator [Methanobacteriaceae archaeon]
MTQKKSKQERVNEITQAAMEVFIKKGYENTTMENIAKKAGVSKGGLYHHFSSKDMILLTVNQKISENIQEIMIKAGKCDSVKKGLIYFIENYLRYWMEHPQETSFLFISIVKIMDNTELLEYYQDFTTDYIKFFEDAFAIGVESGEFIPHDVKISAITLVAAMDGVLSYMILDETLKVDDVIEQFKEKFITSIEA